MLPDVEQIGESSQSFFPFSEEDVVWSAVTSSMTVVCSYVQLGSNKGKIAKIVSTNISLPTHLASMHLWLVR
jgi:hypothetical protein